MYGHMAKSQHHHYYPIFHLLSLHTALPPVSFPILSPVSIIHATTMPKHMRRLYKELWGKPLPIVEEFLVPVPQANYGIRPGYKVDLSSPPESFTAPLFKSKVKEHVFRKVQVGVPLPCGQMTILIRKEYDKVYQLLVKNEAARWDGVPAHSRIPRPHSNLDYQVSGQPGTGICSL